MSQRINLRESQQGLEQQEVQGGELTLGDLLFMIKERWVIGLGVGLLLAALLLFYLLRQTPVYQGSSTLLFNLESNNIVDMEEVVDNDMATGKQLDIELNNHLEKLRSGTFRERVAAAMEADEVESFLKPYADKFEDSTAPDEEKVLLGLKNWSNFGRQRNTQILQISFEHRDPVVAADLANLFAKEYVRYNLDQTGAGASVAVETLKERAAELRVKLTESEKVYFDFRRKNNIVSDEEGAVSSGAKMAAISQKMTDAEVSLADYLVSLEQVGTAREIGQDPLELSFISNYGNISSLVAKRQELEAEKARLSQKYLERHPSMIENAQAFAGLQGVISRAVDTAIADMKSKSAEQVILIERLRDQLESAEGVALDQGGVSGEVNILREQVQTDRSTYEGVMNRLNEALVTSKIENTNIDVVDRASVPQGPIKPNRKMAGLASAGVFGFCFLGVPLALGLTDNKLKRVSEIESYLGVEIAGGIPLIPIKKIASKELAHAVYKDLDESVTESFRGIYSFVELTSQLDFPKTLLVSSTSPSEGKSFVSGSVAYFFGRHGKKTLIIDCDFRKPSQHRNFGISNDAGTLRWINGESSFQDPEKLVMSQDLGIREIPGSNVYLLAAGGSSKSPTEMISSDKFRSLIDALSTQFDLLLIDTPPVGLFPDALFLSEYADEILYVTKHGGLPRQQIRAGLSRFDKAPATVLGVIVNQMKSVKGAGYSYGDYGYGSYSSKYYRKYYDQDR